MASVLHFG